MGSIGYYRKNVFLTIMLAVGVFFLSGCRTSNVPREKIIYRYVEKYRTDTLWNLDSVWIHDSVFVHQKGDTVFKDRWHTDLKYKYLYKVKTDTLIARDTIMAKNAIDKDDALVTIRLGKYAVVTIISILALLIYFCIKKLRYG